MNQEEDEELDCGDSVGHAERVTFEDEESYNMECTRCGAEWREDKEQL